MAAKILLTGRPGVGKTTVVRRALAAGIPLAGGFTTEEIRRAGRRVGFKVTDVHSGTEGALARADRTDRPRVGRYGVDVAAFDAVGVGALRAALGRPGCIVIDEIGKMELCCGSFEPAVREVLESDHPVLATIPVARPGAPNATARVGGGQTFLDALRRRPDVSLIEVTRANRDELPALLAGRLGAAGNAHRGGATAE